MTAKTIPDAALDKHIAFLGTNGSGKTSAAKSAIIEPALEAGERVINIDPTGVGWGLRVSKSGKGAGYPIALFGGERGDYPLLARDAATLAEAYGTSSGSAVFDTTLMTVEERTQFFVGFAETLLRKNRGKLKLVIDEAHLFMPQAGAKVGGLVPKMLHAGNNLISLGRSRGLRITLISQRPAKLHKDSLSQAKTLVAMQMMAPQDRDAVEDWIADQADPGTGKEIIASLPSLQPGEGWVWSPLFKYLERVRFDRPRTFDSSAAPEDDEGDGPKLAPINLDALKGKLARIEAETKANDPRALKADVARLTAEIARAKTEAERQAAPDPKVLEAAEQRGYARGYADGNAIIRRMVESLKAWQAAIADVSEKLKVARDEAQAKLQPAAASPRGLEPPPQAYRAPLPRAAASVAPKPPSRPRGNGDVALSGAQRELLAALAWWAAIGHDAPTRPQIAAKAGWKAKGSHLRNRLSELSNAGLVDYPQSGTVALTEAGAAAAPAPDAGTLVDSIRAALSGAQREVFEALLELGEVSRQDLAERLGWDAGGSHLRNRLSELAAMAIVNYPGRGRVALQHWVN